MLDLHKLVINFYKEYLKKLITTFVLIDPAPLIARPIIMSQTPTTNKKCDRSAKASDANK